MGIQGLSSFINSQPGCFSVEFIRDCRLIVDGHNILHELYYESPSETAYGGDYDVFAKYLDNFLSSVTQKLGLDLLVVFDGAQDTQGKKFSTKLQRAEERIHLAGISTHRSRTKILPILALKVVALKFYLISLSISICEIDY